MTDGREAPRRPARTPLRQRSRRRWAIAGGVALCWVVAEIATHSALMATVLLLFLGGLGVACVVGLRAIGITRDHPWVQRISSRPWRDGQDVLNVALRHLSDVFVVTPSGSVLAPNIVEVQLNPEDLISLRDRLELNVICASATQVYQEQVAAHGARFAGPGQADVYVVPEASVPQGRYRLRQGVPVNASYPSDAPYSPEVEQTPRGGFTHVAQEYAGGYGQHGNNADGVLTVMEPTRVADMRPAIPVLRLVTGSSVAETATSGARAGRGSVELVLPDVPTVSREHATFTFSDGHWRVTNQGRNGLTLNGAPVTGEQPVSDGDSIRWGMRPDALLSRVEIG